MESFRILQQEEEAARSAVAVSGGPVGGDECAAGGSKGDNSYTEGGAEPGGPPAYNLPLNYVPLEEENSFTSLPVSFEATVKVRVYIFGFVRLYRKVIVQSAFGAAPASTKIFLEPMQCLALEDIIF